MYKPNVTFVLNERCKQLDIIYTDFFFSNPDKSGGFEKRERLIEQYPALDKYAQSKEKELLVNTINKIHSDYTKELSEAKNKAERLWKEKEVIFLDLCESVFEGHSFPEGDYNCYLSVIDINTLIKKEKSFQLFFGAIQQGISTTIIAHEMLHFIFYDYMDKYKNLDKKKLWEFAEIFNKYIQNSIDFIDFMYPKEKVLEKEYEIRLENIREKFENKTVSISDFINFYNQYYSLL